MSDTDDGGVVADLSDVAGSGGALWSLPHGGDLDANLVRLEAGGSVGEHVNDEVDVLVYVQSGNGVVQLDEALVEVTAHHLVLIPKSTARSVTAGPSGLTYLSVHRRRGLLSISGARIRTP